MPAVAAANIPIDDLPTGRERPDDYLRTVVDAAVKRLRQPTDRVTVDWVVRTEDATHYWQRYGYRWPLPEEVIELGCIARVDAPLVLNAPPTTLALPQRASA